MILHYPSWQGIGFPTTVTDGADRFCKLLPADATIHTVPVAEKSSITNQDGIFGRAQATQQIESALGILDREKPKKILTIGGDCSVEMAPATYLNTLYDGDIQIFWFDAHADINTPDMSFSGHLHGMPLAFLAGMAPDDPLQSLMRKPITPDQIAFIGLRSIDPPEEELIARHAIKNLRFADLPAMQKKYTRAIVHVDTDVLDASIYNECATPTTGGTSLETLLVALDTVFAAYDVVGATITEYAPAIEGQNQKGKTDKALPLVSEIFKTGLRAGSFSA